MGEFFCGWRRKIGCITLVMACLLGGFWARAFFYDDAITLTIFGRTYMIRNWCQNVSWYEWPAREHAKPAPIWTSATRLLGGPINGVPRYRCPHREYLLAVLIHGNDFINKSWDLRHDAILIPLVLLSASLIFWKPKKRRSHADVPQL